MEKRLLTASPLKPFVWKRFIFSLWKIPMNEVSIFVNFANSFHPTINFTCEMSSERAVFLHKDVFKGPPLSTLKPGSHLCDNSASGVDPENSERGGRVPHPPPPLPRMKTPLFRTCSIQHFGTSKHGEGKSLSKNFFRYTYQYIGRFNRANKK